MPRLQRVQHAMHQSCDPGNREHHNRLANTAATRPRAKNEQVVPLVLYMLVSAVICLFLPFGNWEFCLYRFLGFSAPCMVGGSLVR
jgi:hypothetical protein